MYLAWFWYRWITWIVPVDRSYFRGSSETFYRADTSRIAEAKADLRRARR